MTWHRIGKQGGRYWGKRGAGIVFTDGKSILLLRRSEKGDNNKTWGIPGGKAEEGETFLGTAQRETREETGHLPNCQRLTDIHTKDGRHNFRTYVCFIPERFSCELSDEHDAWEWADIDKLKHLKLHPKFEKVLPAVLHSIETRHFTRGGMSGLAETINFSEILGASGPAIYTGKKHPDWNWEGAPESMIRPKRRRKKRKK